MTTPRTASLALLRAALLTGPDAAAAAAAWLAAADLEHLPPAHYPLLPLALSAVEQAAAGHPWLGRLRGLYRRAWYANQLMLRAAARLIQALGEAGTPAMLADAASLAWTAYRDRLRPIGALTLIAPVEQAATACAVLAAQGAQALTPEVARSGTEEIWLTGQRWRLPDTHLVELQWHAAPFWPSAALDRAAWERARPIALAERAALMLGGADQLARSCYAATLPGPAALVALTDAAVLLMASRGGQPGSDNPAAGQAEAIDWEVVLQLAETGHIGRALRATLECLETIVHVGAPPDVMARLRALPRSSFEAMAGVVPLPASAPVGRMRAARLVYTQYRRAAAARGLQPKWGTFLTFLQQRWGLSRRSQLFKEMVARLRR